VFGQEEGRLQDAITLLKGREFDFALQFVNYR